MRSEFCRRRRRRCFSRYSCRFSLVFFFLTRCESLLFTVCFCGLGRKPKFGSAADTSTSAPATVDAFSVAAVASANVVGITARRMAVSCCGRCRSVRWPHDVSPAHQAWRSASLTPKRWRRAGGRTDRQAGRQAGLLLELPMMKTENDSKSNAPKQRQWGRRSRGPPPTLQLP